MKKLQILEQLAKTLVARRGKWNPEMLMKSVCVIYAVVVFERTCDDISAGHHGVNRITDRKGDVIAYIDVNFTFIMDMVVVNIERRPGIYLYICCRHFKRLCWAETYFFPSQKDHRGGFAYFLVKSQ